MASRPVPLKVDFLVKCKSEAAPISKSMKLLFTFFHIIFGLDFGFVKSKPQYLIKILTFFQVSAIVLYLTFEIFVSYSNQYSSWFYLDVVIYFLFAILMLRSKYTYYDFQMDLLLFDKEIKVSDTYKVEYKIFFWVLIVLTFKTCLAISYCAFLNEYCDFPFHVNFVYHIAVLGLNTVLIAFTFLFNIVNYRIKKFCIFLQNDIVDVVSCQYIYKNIVEITERAKKTFDLVFVLSLVYNTVDVALTVYVPFIETLKESGYQPSEAVSYTLVVQELLMLFAPAITAGQLSSQVEALQLVLYDRLVKDQKNIRDIKRFINYIDARPLIRFKVWAVIPLDWSLPVIIVNIAITYLIVMIQFTH